MRKTVSSLVILASIILSGCVKDQIKVDPQPYFIYKVKPINLPVTHCADEPFVPDLLIDKAKKPKDTDALQWTEDSRLAALDCRDGVAKDKEYQDSYNKAVDAFNADADKAAAEISKVK